MKLLADSRKLLDAAQTETRDLTSEEQSSYDTQFAEQRKLGEKITRWDRHLEVERELGEATQRSAAQDPANDGDPPGNPPANTNGNGTARSELRYALPETRFGARNRGVQPAAERVIPYTNGYRCSDEYRDAYSTFLKTGRRQFDASQLSEGDRRALQSDDESLGGSMVPDEQFVAELIKFVDDAVVIRQLSRVIQVTRADGLGLRRRAGNSIMHVQRGRGHNIGCVQSPTHRSRSMRERGSGRNPVNHMVSLARDG